MEELIPIASKLQDVLGALGQNTSLDLPQIVVIGGQSSGKSSVLESIVGRSFLPRGTGIVTRRPLILQLFNTAEGKDEFDDEEEDDERKSDHNVSTRRKQRDRTGSFNEDHEEWGEFLHHPGRRYTDFTSIRDEIQRDTDRLSGRSKGVSSQPIHLKIYSPKVLTLTMVDLPGLTKVAVEGQPEDIADQIWDMNVEFGSNPNAILLAVTGANTDLASSDALKLARELDPRGERTIGVLTKLDLMDPGTDAAEILGNKVIPLRRGYVAVVNRGQRDIDADLSIRNGLRNEERFFRTHPVYSRDRSIAGKCGTMNLARNLNGILIHHIRDCLPELKIRIANMMGDVQEELDALGEEGGGDEMGALGGKLLGLLSKFTANFAAMIDGKASNTNQHHDGMPVGNGMNGIHMGMDNMSLNRAYNTPGNSSTIGANADELYGGARISYIFHQVFSRSLNSVGAFDGLSEDEIRTTIGNANGTRPALFVPEISFDILVRRQIRRLEQPGVQCVDLVYDELQRIAHQSEPTELTRYPNLRDRMLSVVGALLKRSVGPTQMWVSNLVRIELSYINTNHPDFIGGSRAVAKLMEKMAHEKEKAAIAATNSVSLHSHHPQHVSVSNKEGTMMTPVKERNTSPEIGATPLSSSSLEKYMAADDGYVSQPGAPPQHVVVDRSNSGAALDNSGGGIMNFIFRGNHASSSSNAGMGGINRSNSWNNRKPNSRPAGGPPAIVQLPQVPDTMRQTDAPPSDREKVETEIIKSLIDSYFSIVRKNYIDMVPKTIMYFLVNHVKDEMQNELVSELYREAEVGFLMKEAEDIATRRRTCIEMRDLLEKALEIVNEVRDFNTFGK
ncbi:hypothetical protein ACHAWO_007283 [Cyclotella atomus]|uniref:Dynamin GTPase n=1 Tax=Cyclotella atomus TaxID=382360 RepID=A0ABD3N3P7_9STRA